jgi:hypothetical protein
VAEVECPPSWGCHFSNILGHLLLRFCPAMTFLIASCALLGSLIQMVILLTCSAEKLKRRARSKATDADFRAREN